MKCPRCGEILLGIGNGLYECLSCSYVGTFRNITELKLDLHRVDALIESKKMEIEYLLDARREAIIRGGKTYLKKVLENYGFRNITNLEDGVYRIDALIETIKTRIEQLLDARREAMIRGSNTCLKVVLGDYGVRTSKPAMVQIRTGREKKSVRSTFGLIVASAEVGAFLDWFANSFYALMDGKIPLVQGIVPIILLFHGIILIIVAS